MESIRNNFYFLVACVLSLTCNSLYAFEDIQDYSSKELSFPEKTWKRIEKPSNMNWSEKKLTEAKKYLSNFSNGSYVIIDRGIIIDNYGSTEKKYPLYSIRKSILSAMYGVYTEKINTKKNLLQLNINDKDKLTKQELQATISDLLKARSGVYHKAVYETKSMKKKRPKREKYKPGEHWYYNNWDFNALLTIFEQETQEKFFISFEKNIAKPISMQHFSLKNTKYVYNYNTSMHPAYTFKMTPLDLARFGLLILNKGKWKNKQIISQEWLNKSFIPYSKVNTRICNEYGYMWWLNKKMICASGYGGQWLVIFPKKNIIIVHLVNKKNRLKASKFKTFLKKVIMSKN